MIVIDEDLWSRSGDPQPRLDFRPVLANRDGSFAPGILFVAATLLLTIGLVTLVAAHQRATAVALEAS